MTTQNIVHAEVEIVLCHEIVPLLNPCAVHRLTICSRAAQRFTKELVLRDGFLRLLLASYLGKWNGGFLLKGVKKKRKKKKEKEKTLHGKPVHLLMADCNIFWRRKSLVGNNHCYV